MRFTLEKDIKNRMAGSVHKTNTYGNSCMRFLASAPWLALALAIAGCGTRPLAKSESHIQAESVPAAGAASIPQVIRTVPMPPSPESRETEIKYSVVVANQPVREVLLAMARETRVNF
ncbi:MAG TPA: hypothetical protein VF386_05865, partial [Usitatibacter sp.]